MTLPRLRSSLWPLLLIAAVLILVAACAGPIGGSPGASGAPATPTPQAAIPLAPVSPTEPFSFLAWLFTPIFQAFFVLLVVLDKLTGNIAIAIVLMT
ncbi:MAG TPA: hypothetical protein VGO64_01635, partial [Candidatus Limnocylindrales bacterium]|nr:hypothetical protein [Candidatus Limnocylindrales bacterium]